MDAAYLGGASTVATGQHDVQGIQLWQDALEDRSENVFGNVCEDVSENVCEDVL